MILTVTRSFLIFLFFYLTVNVIFADKSLTPIENLISEINESKNHKRQNLLEEYRTRYKENIKAHKKDYDNYQIFSGNSVRYISSVFYRFAREFQDATEEVKLEISDTKARKPQYYSEIFSEMKKSGGEIKNGDILLWLAPYTSSYLYAFWGGGAYSHVVPIYIKNNIPYVIHNSVNIGVVIVKLSDVFSKDFGFPVRFAIYRYKGFIDPWEVDYLFNLVEKQISNMFFDKFAILNKKIRDPEKYFLKSNFFYCTEMTYLLYDYFFIEGGDAMIDEEFPLNKMMESITGKTLFFPVKNRFISPKSIIDSNLFKPVYIYGSQDSIKDPLMSKSYKEIRHDILFKDYLI